MLRARPGLPRLTAVLLFFAAISPLLSQTVDPFNPDPSGSVYAIATQPDGRLIIGGSFTGVGLQTQAFLARLEPDGMLDGTFKASANGLIFDVAVQNDGKIIVAGWFSKLNQTPRASIGRLHLDGSLDLLFNPGPAGGETYPGVYSVLIQADSKILVAGDFRSIAGYSRTNIARLNPDGSLDTSFNARADNIVYPMALQEDGKILLGGDFRTINGKGRNFIARINSDGALDQGFNPGAGGTVLSFLVQPDQKILVGGAFGSLGGGSRGNIGRLDPNGTLDATFTPQADAPVRSLALQTDGKILVGGSFTNLAGQKHNYFGRLNADGTLDASITNTTGGIVYAVTLQREGSIMIGGAFATISGQARKNMGRINNPTAATETLSFDGSSITWLRGGSSPEVWRSGMDFSTNGRTWTSLGEAQRIEGGWFMDGLDLPLDSSIRVRGFAASGRYNCSSSIVEANLGRIVGDPVGIVLGPVSQTNKAGYYVKLSVEATGTYPLKYQWYADGACLSDGNGISGTKLPTLTFSNINSTNAGDYFVVVTNAVSAITSAVATLTVIDPYFVSEPSGKFLNFGWDCTLNSAASGSQPLYYQWFRKGIPIPSGTNGTLTLTGVSGYDSGLYYVTVSNHYGFARSGTALLSVTDPLISSGPASVWTNVGSNLSFQISAKGTSLTYQWRKDRTPLPLETETFLALTNVQVSDGGRYDVVVNGGYGSVTSSVAVLGVNTVIRDHFTGSASSVRTLCQQPDGKTLLGGDFTMLNGESRKYIGRLKSDGTLDTSFQAESSGSIYSFALQADERILVVGAFTNLNGVSRKYLGRLHQDGSLDETFTPAPNSSVTGMKSLEDGRILVGGWFNRLGGQTCSYLGRLNADGTLDTNFVAQLDAAVSTIVDQPDGRLLISGSFTTLGGEPHRYIGRLHKDGRVDSSFNATPSDYVECIALQSDGKILVGGRSRNSLCRLNADGTVDLLFKPNITASAVSTIALQTDGKLIITGSSLKDEYQRGDLLRLNADGSTDTSLSPQQNGGVTALLIQGDGKLLVSGSFTALAGEASAGLARLKNPPCTSWLTINGPELAWLRTGTAAEVSRTTFESSRDGMEWLLLGSGTRTNDGWRLTCSSNLPVNTMIRARGFVSGCANDNSEWFVEEKAAVAMPQITLYDGNLGFHSNKFGFSLAGMIGQEVVIESSTNLVDWFPLGTNLLGTNPSLFLDGDSPVSPARLYRLRAP